MKTFGLIKTKILNNITESYATNKKGDVKKLIKLIKENQDVKNLYLLYEDVENKYIQNEEVAKIYIDQLSTYLTGKKNTITKDLKKLVESDEKLTVPEVYSYLDTLCEEDNIFNIEKKIQAKFGLKEYLLKEKEQKEYSGVFTENYKLLNVVLASNFNSTYSESLNEEEKEVFKKILKMSEDDLINEINDLKNNIGNTIDKLIKETEEESLKEKLEETKKAVDSTKYNKYELVKLENLKKQLCD